MKVSVNWMKQFVPELDLNKTKQIVNNLGMSLAEVENYYKIGEHLNNIVAGKILKIEDLQGSKTLKIVIVAIKKDNSVKIISGAKNIRVDDMVPICLPGGSIINANDKTGQTYINITKKEFQGIQSSGVLCSQKELGMGEDHSGIFLLPNNTQIGTDISNLLKDTIIEIENKGITNRPDCFSHVGIAREIAVQNKFQFEGYKNTLAPMQTDKKTLTIEIDNNNIHTRRYGAVVISNIKIGPSPLWMQARLLTNDIRPINNIVDITNYLMLELGQPSHAFDYDKIKDHTLIMRYAKSGESIKTLDGKKRILSTDMLINADKEKPIGIAGIMGAENSEIDDNTTTIILQVENLEMYNIRGTSRKLGLRTEASTRFEKGLDPQLTKTSLHSVANMIINLAGGAIASEIFDIYPNPETSIQIDFDINLVKSFLGLSIEKKEIIDILSRLEIKTNFNKNNESIIQLTIPSFRRDLRLKEDILEEIIRIWGFNKIPFILPMRTLSPAKKNIRFELEKKIISYMSAIGSNEIYTYAFIGTNLYAKAELSTNDNLRIVNPLSPELEYMRDTLLPSLIDKAQLNLKRYTEIDMFEISKTALKQVDRNSMHIQPKYLSGIMINSSNDIYRMVKGKITSLLNHLGVPDIRYESFESTHISKKGNMFHPNKTALLYHDDKYIGVIGYIHPKVADNFEITANTVIYEIDFDILSKISTEVTNYTRIYNQPIVKRVLSFWVDEKLGISKIMEQISNSKIPYLIDYEIIDIYRDKKIDGKKSLSLKIKLQSKQTTLTVDEITNSIKQIEQIIETRLQGTIRDS